MVWGHRGGLGVYSQILFSCCPSILLPFIHACIDHLYRFEEVGAMEIEVEQLQQARALASVQQTAKQMAAELDEAWAAQKRETEVAQERQDQVCGLVG